MWIQYYLPQDFKLVSINAPCIGAENVVLWVHFEINIIEIMIYVILTHYIISLN